jgi:hypothetical protein
MNIINISNFDQYLTKFNKYWLLFLEHYYKILSFNNLPILLIFFYFFKMNLIYYNKSLDYILFNRFLSQFNKYSCESFFIILIDILLSFNFIILLLRILIKKLYYLL